MVAGIEFGSMETQGATCIIPEVIKKAEWTTYLMVFLTYLQKKIKTEIFDLSLCCTRIYTKSIQTLNQILQTYWKIVTNSWLYI